MEQTCETRGLSIQFSLIASVWQMGLPDIGHFFVWAEFQTRDIFNEQSKVDNWTTGVNWLDFLTLTILPLTPQFPFKDHRRRETLNVNRLNTDLSSLICAKCFTYGPTEQIQISLWLSRKYANGDNSWCFFFVIIFDIYNGTPYWAARTCLGGLHLPYLYTYLPTLTTYLLTFLSMLVVNTRQNCVLISELYK